MPDRYLPAADELAIRNLIAKYAIYADHGRADDFANLFVPDGSWTRENSPPVHLGGSGRPPETRSGHALLKDMIVAVIVDQFKCKFRHQMTDILVEPGEGSDSARAVFRALITNWRDGAGKLAMCGTYTCRFTRTGDGWRFVSVSIYVLPD
jgi:hypothetical protein